MGSLHQARCRAKPLSAKNAFRVGEDTAILYLEGDTGFLSWVCANRVNIYSRVMDALTNGYEVG